MKEISRTMISITINKKTLSNINNAMNKNREKLRKKFSVFRNEKNVYRRKCYNRKSDKDKK